MIETTESISVQVTDGMTHLATIQCSYTPDRRVTASMTLTSAYQEASHRALVEDAYAEFFDDVIYRLYNAGIPVKITDKITD